MKNQIPNRRGNIAGGLIIIAVGLWFLLSQLGVNLPGFDRLWPLFPAAGGLVFILAFMFGSNRDPGFLFAGVGGLLIGLFFFLFTLDLYPWSAMAYLWPAYPLIGGLAFLASYFGGRGKEPGLLVPGLGGVAVGLIAFLFTVAGLSLAWLGTYWPIFLILGGLLLLLQNAVRGGKSG